MANTFQTPAQAALVAANLVAEDGFLSALVSHNYQDAIFAPGKGGAPIAIKQPTTLIARERDLDDVATAIVMDEITEAVETLNLDRKMLYSAVPMSEADLALNVEDFSSQVLKPQAAAIVDDLEYKVASALLGLDLTQIADPANAANALAYDATDPIPFFTRLRKMLRDNGLPMAGINVVAGTEVYANLLDAKAITDVSESGSTAALREGGVGRIRGFNIVESTRVSETEIVAFHRDAVTLATRAPAVPKGASFGASVAEKGVNLRYLQDYDADHTIDRSILATFAAVGFLPVYKITKDRVGRSVTVTKNATGGALRLDVATQDGAALL